MNYTPRHMLGVALLVLVGSASAHGQADVKTRPAPAAQASPNADNTKLNARDAGDATATPQAQPNAKADRDVLAAVRKSIVHDKSLSVYAHNVKIVVSGGAVTLRGPVKSDDEKNKVGALAKAVTGVSSVDNQVDIKTN